MKVRTLVDTGPLVALLKGDDAHHEWSVAAMKQRPAEGLATCEAVLSEACYLLAPWPRAIDALFGRVEEGTLQVLSLVDETTAVHALMRKYRDVPASYADACLIRLSEQHAQATLLTLDSDFRVYRRLGRQAIAQLSPR